MYDEDDFEIETLFIDVDGDYGIVVDMSKNGTPKLGELKCICFTDDTLSTPYNGKSEIYVGYVVCEYVAKIIPPTEIDMMVKSKIKWLLKKYKKEIEECQ